MKYLFLSISIIFGIAGISQAMDLLGRNTLQTTKVSPLSYDLQYISISFTPAPVAVKILLLSLGFFLLYLIWKKLKELGIGNLYDYIPE